jgi:hypothetical protein
MMYAILTVIGAIAVTTYAIVRRSSRFSHRARTIIWVACGSIALATLSYALASIIPLYLALIVAGIVLWLADTQVRFDIIEWTLAVLAGALGLGILSSQCG